MSNETEASIAALRAELKALRQEISRLREELMASKARNERIDLTKAVGQLTKTVVDVQNGLAETNKGLIRLEGFVMAEMPRKFAEIAAVVMLEDLAKGKCPA